MRILITGGTGLIGTPLVQRLVSDGYQVVVLSRSPQKIYSRFCNAVECWTSLADKKNLNNFDAVINLAGEPIIGKRWDQAQKEILCESRWQITQRLSQLIKASTTPPSVFISGSAVGYYGNQDQFVVTEEATPHDEFTHRLCAQWEKIALQAEAVTTRVCLLRTGIVLSKHGGALQKLLPIFRYGLGGPIGSGKQYMPWIHIDDMVEAICFLLKTPQLQGPFNMTAPYPVTNQQFSAILGEVLHRPAFIKIPAFAIKLVLGEAAVIALGGQHAIPDHLEKSGFTFLFSELKDALKDILLKQEQ